MGTMTPVTGTLVRENAQDREPRVVDNPFRRESHRPWYARRGPRWVVALAVALLLGLNAFAFKKVGTRTDPITVDTAVARYRSSATTPQPSPNAAARAPEGPAAVATGTAGTSNAAPAPGAAAEQSATSAGAAGEMGVGRGPTPAPGVYVYDTAGFERVSALGGAQHDYPKQSTMTVTDNDCGITVRWSPLEQRFEQWRMCGQGTAIKIASVISHHEFFGQTEERTYQCGETFVRLPSDAPGTTASGTCRAPSDTARTTTTAVGLTHIVVGGVSVDAIQAHFEHEVSGNTTGTQRGDVWVRPSDGLILRYLTVIDADTNSVIGPTHFHEEIALNLAELAPRR
jgi:hypothetical protein